MSNYTKFDLDNYPPPLITSKADNQFAYRTIAIRKPKIVQQLLTDHAGQYPNEIEEALQDLHDELAQGQPVRPLKTSAPDGESWYQVWQPYQNKTWFEIPWFFAEVFFYRRLLEVVGYFGNSMWAGVDPFLPRKQIELDNDIPWQVLGLALEHASKNSSDNFCLLLRHCIWGNRVDLSHPQLVDELRQQAGQQKPWGDLIADDTEAVLAHLQTANPVSARVDFICDNAGTELLLDFALLDFLLRYDWVRQVTLHLKAHPTYVSDTTPADIEMTLNAMKKRPESAIQVLAERLEYYRHEGRLQIQSHFFWNSSRFFWEFPPDIENELAQAQLVIIKGDANYRRLLGDAHWPPTVPFAAAAPFFPAPFVTLRTMKSDVVVGLKTGQPETLDVEDAEWRINGRRGVIQSVF